MVEVIKAMVKLNIALQNTVYATQIANFPTALKYGMVISEIGIKMRSTLWQDGGFQECIRHAIEYQPTDSAQYYFQRMDEILRPSYIPTEQDVASYYNLVFLQE